MAVLLSAVRQCLFCAHYTAPGGKCIVRFLRIFRFLPSHPEEKPNANVFAITGTAFHFLGLIIAAMVWYEERTATATAIGLILTVIGVMIYGIGMAVADASTKESAKRLYRSVNVWTLTFIPLSLIYNVFVWQGPPAPYPVPARGVRFALFLLCYLAIGITASLRIRKAKQNK